MVSSGYKKVVFFFKWEHCPNIFNVEYYSIIFSRIFDVLWSKFGPTLSRLFKLKAAYEKHIGTTTIGAYYQGIILFHNAISFLEFLRITHTCSIKIVRKSHCLLL